MSCTSPNFIAYDSDGQLISVCVQDSLTTGSASISTDVDTMWLLVAGFLVFFMQLGFTMLEVGAVRPKNIQNILFKNLADACIGAIVWLCIGWPLAYGVTVKNPSEFIGSKDWAIHDSKDFANFFFQWCFAATAATIVSGAVAGRMTLHSYFAYTIFITGFVYPVVVYWVWSGEGWLSYGNEKYIIDFAGSGVVHMVGGFSGLMGAIIAGPRVNVTVQHSVPFQVFGTFILWFGWYGFNCGSTLGTYGLMGLASRVAVNTTIAAASGGIGAMVLARAVEGSFSPARMCNGILAGLVSVTAPCAVIGVGSAIPVGLIGSVVYMAGSLGLEKLGVDDVLDACPVHGLAGAWGLLASGLFSTDDLVDDAYGDHISYGKRVGYQIVGILAIMGWTIVFSGSFFVITDLVLKALGESGIRVDDEVEKKGLDVQEHGGSAWHYKSEDNVAGATEQATGGGKMGVEIQEYENKVVI